jgi:hypothetical protein
VYIYKIRGGGTRGEVKRGGLNIYGKVENGMGIIKSIS